MKSNRLSDWYKVPFREVYCETFWLWLQSTFRCHVSLRLTTLSWMTFILVGCASSHVGTIPSLPVSAPAAVASAVAHVNTNSAVELQALRSAISAPVSSPAPKPVVAPNSTAVPVAPAVAPPMPSSSPVVAATNSSITKTTMTPPSHKLIYWLLTTILAVPLTWAAKKYGMPLFKKFLAWIKTHNVVSDLKTLAEEAKTKLVVDFRDVEAKIDPPSAPAPAPAPAAHTATSAEKAFASAEVKKA